jgi:hypothetical protein
MVIQVDFANTPIRKAADRSSVPQTSARDAERGAFPSIWKPLPYRVMALTDCADQVAACTKGLTQNHVYDCQPSVASTFRMCQMLQQHMV